MKKRAILFGMVHYANSSSVSTPELPSAVFDVMILEKRLKQLQFETSSYIDLGLQDVKQKFLEFAAAAPCDSLNVVYFSGHGGHSRGENYLYPVDFGTRLDLGLSINESALNLNNIYPHFTQTVKLLIIVDACRDNLTPGYAGDFSEMVAPQNTYIAYATQFGTCSNCTSKVSYFTEALCEYILTPNISIDQLFTNVRATLYLRYGKQISNSVNGLMSDVTLNKQAQVDDVGQSVLRFVDQYADMYTEKYGLFAGDDLVYIDAAQYCNISVLDAIYKYLTLDAERSHVNTNFSESHEKLIAFWGMLNRGLKQDEFYTWQYRGRPIRLGEIPPLPLDLQKPMPEKGKEIVVDIKIDIRSNEICILTNLPDNYQFYGKINNTILFSNIVVKGGSAKIPLPDNTIIVQLVDLYSSSTTASRVDKSIVGDRCRNITGKYVKFNPISGNFIEFHYKKA